MIKLLLKNPYVILALVLSALGAFGGYSYFMYNKGVKSERAACNADKKDTIDESIQTRFKQDEVITPDTATYVNSLRRNTF